MADNAAHTALEEQRSWRDQYETVTTQNQAFYERLTELGKGLNLTGVRLELLIETMLPWADGNNTARLVFEVMSGQRAQTELQAAIAKTEAELQVESAPAPAPNDQGPA